MKCPENEGFLDDFVDGPLTDDERREFELHLAVCRTCRSAVAERHALQRAVADLPESIPPARDLLPEIRDTLRQRGRLPAATRRRALVSGPWLRWAGAAAALLVVATIGWMIGRGHAVAERVADSTGGDEFALVSGDTTTDELLDAEREYLAASARLMSLIEKRRAQLSPETARVLDENLDLINQAIDEVHQAFEADPENPQHGHALTALYRKKLETLWRASRLAS